MEIINNAPNVPKPVGPYSQAVIANGLIFTAGQVGIDPVTEKMVSGGIEAQTARVLKNLEGLLIFCGSSFDRVVMTTIFLTEITHGKVVNELYGEVVNPLAPPARQTVAVKELPLGALVEISLVAMSK